MFNTVVKIGGFDHIKPVYIGENHPVAVQTMWKEKLVPSDLEGKRGEALVSRISRLADMGCALLRFAVPDMADAETLGRLAGMVSMPLVADIHFDYTIACRCLDFPIAKIRINPGNIGVKENTAKVLEKAGAKGVPVRIGLNAGSLPPDLRQKTTAGEIGRVDALVQAVEREFSVFEEFHFNNVVVSAKASSTEETVKVNRILKKRLRSTVPLHIGVTEAGPLVAGVVRNTAALYTLLSEGVGDTVRASLSDSVENEVIAAREILRAVAERRGEKLQGVSIVSCPRCGRNSFDTHAFTEKWLPALYSCKKPVTVAVMGCVVNGPGEAKHADIGVTGAGGKTLLFRYGKIVKTINSEDADREFEALLREYRE
ncbi:MAG: (E)-4-hydroxy-3-methylbut-2-enyl-diphosphate synthase [Treponema sp.]|jgi:(E)-4-hydroxy-3-methylbut-2-enyl-diphosphate synthase|nr:(E)-4-hydroxy-3-methylbut-2-enyl-diphosphate synthase [Treponema sp.]